VEFIIGISTDKAAQVNGTYGATKFLMEKLFSDYEANYPAIKYRIVRYGNVLYSTGSVLCKWKDLLQDHKEVTVTDLDASRFFWTREQAIDLIFDCLDKAVDSSPYCPEMKSIRIGDLLEAMQIKYGTASRIKVIGLQPGENLHEKILEKGKFSNEVQQYTIKEIMELI
jgi:UDP-N-acetylglucosamine 4,6-dehydratase/UDP-glucose 4-epimerase